MITFRPRGFAVASFAALIAIALGMLAPAGAGAAFPGADGPIAFTSNRDTAAGEIYSIIPGGDALRLTDSNKSADAVYSPDGTRIAFVDANNEIAVMDVDGTNPTPITDSSTAKQEPTWSPDGTKVAYVASSFDVDGATDLEIWTVNAGGGGVVQITHNTFPDSEPAWSPSGTRIAFVATRPGDTNRNVYVMDADGTDEVSITPNEALPCDGLCYQGHDDSPAWAPDGSRIAYVHNQTENGGGPPNIWTMDPNGSNKVNLSNSATSFIEPAWSPQGTRLAAVGTATASTDRNIWVMNADGSGQAPIDTATSHERDPDWGVLDTTPPNTTITSGPANGSTIGASDATFGFSSPDADTARFECRLDGGAFSTCGSPQPYSNLSDGPHTFSVRAVDSAGNADATPAERSFTTDTALSAQPTTAKKTQKQKGKKIVVKLRVAAGEDLTARGAGKVKVGKKSYKLRPQVKQLAAGESKNLKLKPKKKKDAKKIAKALDKGAKAKAKLKLTLTDKVGNKQTEKLTVKLKR